MKVQDVVFVVIFLYLFIKRDPRLPVFAGLVSLSLSIPLFTAWVFFTAERLTWYSAAFFALSVFLYIFKQKTVKQQK